MRRHRKLLALLLAFELIVVQLFTMQSEWTSISARADETELIDETNPVSTVNPISTVSPTSPASTASTASPVSTASTTSPTNTVNPIGALTPSPSPMQSPVQMTSDNDDELSETTPTPDTQETPLPEKTADPIKGMPEPTENSEPTDENETNINQLVISPNAQFIDGTEGDDTLNGTNNDDIINGYGGNDTIYGNNGNDLIQGGAGNDVLYGDSGDDTYLFNAGYGDDIVYDPYGNNMLRFTGGITIVDFKTEHSGSHLVLINKITDERTKIYNFYSSTAYRNYTLIFDDGSEVHILGDNSPLWTIYGTAGNDNLASWSLGTHTIKIYGLEGNDTLTGTNYADEIYGEDGEDTIYGNNGDDLIVGGAGNDVLYGDSGDDTYLFNAGYGDDIVYDPYGNNMLRFTGGITIVDFKTERSGSHLILINKITDERTKIYNFYSSTAYRNYTLTFDDGTEEHILGDNSPLWTIYGTAGNDNLASWSLGTHTIKIYGLAGNDTLTGTDYADEIYGEDGEDTIYGNNGNDLIVGGAGNDVLYGDSHNDTYLFETGYGDDIVYDPYGNNFLKFTGGITIVDFKTERSGSHLILINKITDERTKIYNFYSSTAYRNYTLIFDDGSRVHILGDNSPLWTIYGTEGNDNLASWSLGTHTIKIYGLEGNDTLTGTNYADEIYGEDGEDTIYGNNGDDLIVGGAGNDVLYGDSGDDTYLFNAGYGDDIVYDPYGNNILKFTGGITIVDFKTERSGSHLVLINKITNERTKIYNFYSSTAYRNYTLTFDNGSRVHILGDNSPLWTIYGTDGNDNLASWSLGTHTIKIYGLAGNDTLTGTDYADEIYGDAGNDVIYGNNGNDFIVGGVGNDTLYGDSGNDTYLLWAGCGNDIISDCYGNNIIRFTGATTPSNLTLEKSGSYDLKITNSLSGETTTLYRYTYNSAYRNYVVEFADFSVYNIVQSTENTNLYYLTPAQPIADANEPNNTFDTATAVSLSATINGSISVPSDIDYFTVTVNEGGAYEITATLSNIPYGRNYELEIYQKCANKYYKISESKNTGSVSETCNKYIQAGTYYIKVYSAVGYSSANYTLNISSTNVANVSMPLSGYERAYEPNKWNTGAGAYIQTHTNCYAYALNLVRHPITGETFPLDSEQGFLYVQPGQFHNANADYRPALNDFTGKGFIDLCTNDANAIGGIFKSVKRDEVCPAGTYKVALVMNTGSGVQNDYHWYKQNSDGTWSHKRGATNVVNTDDSNNIITDPLTANRGKYFVFVGYFAVKSIESGDID